MTVAAFRLFRFRASSEKLPLCLSPATALLTTLLTFLLTLGTSTVNAQGHQFIFSDAQAPFNPFTQPSRPQQQFLNIPYRQEPAGFRPSVGDLQTSDLPSHLQHTLPQYRFQNQPQHVVSFQDDTPPNQFGHFTFPNSEPTGFRSTHQFPKPTTMRPNYSHLFSKTRNRDPSQTETFLGQITLQSPPIEDPPQFDVFPEVANNPYADGVEGNSVGGNNGRNGFLNHRSRFVAPDQPLKKPQVKDYFVDNHGDVYSTTKAPRTTPPSTKSTIQERKYPFKSPSKAKPPVPFNLEKERKGIQTKSPRQKAADLEPLLEEPLKENFGTSNDDEVEVIQSENDTIVGKSGDDHRRPKMLPLSPTKESSKTTQSSDPSTTYYDDNEELSTHLPTESDDYAEDELYEEEEDQKNNNDNDIQGGEDNDQHEANQEKDQPSEEHSQVLTTSKPTTTNSKGKLYTSIDRTFRYPTTEPPTTAIDDLEPTTFSPSISSSKSVSFKRGEQMLHKEPELVISVVTSKTVINNTVVAPVTEVPTVTESIKGVATTPTTAVDNTTEAWVVVASVQTSRSVSGARYLPSSIVEQDIRVKLLNEHATEDDDDSDHDHQHQDDDSDEEEDDEDEEHTTTETTIMPTTTRPKTSTESLIDKLDGLQSDLSSGVLTGGLGNNIAVIKETTLETTTASTSTSANYPSTTSKPYPQVKIRKFSPANRPTTTRKPRPKPGEKKPFDINQLQGDQPRKPVDIASILPPNYKLNASDDRSLRILQELVDRNLKNKKKDESSTTSTAEQTTENGLKITQDVDITKFLPPGYKLNESELTTENVLLKELKTEDISKFLPPGYKLPKEDETTSSKSAKTTEPSIFKNTKADDVSKFLPPGYKLPKSDDRTTERSSTKADDLSKFLPPGYKLPKSGEKTTEASLFKNTKTDDLSKFLPPGYKGSTESSIFKNTKADDVSKFLPPGYKIPKYKENSTPSSIHKNTKADDVSKFLPPGYKIPKTTPKSELDDSAKQGDKVPPKAQPIDISAILPPGYNATAIAPADLLPPGFKPSTETAPTTSKPSKVVFPTRPGGGVRKSATRTTPKSISNVEMQKPTPTIHKGWPSRATTEFTGWPTPSTTPISVEKLLEAARAAQAAKTGPASTTTPTPSTTTTPTTTTTTTMRPTTPGVCVDECDLAGTIKMVDGVKWQPELLDRNTREWQVLANEVQTQLDYVFSSSPELSRWYRKIRIDGFSEGSVLVDYLVELNDLGRRVDTQEIKQLFHESLDDALTAFGNSKRGGKSLNESVKLEGKLTLGNFVIDPIYTDFLVLPKQNYPTVGYADNDVLLPQWAIAVIVIGLASLLFVIIFGVTVLVNRQKNAKKKNPTPLTEDMLNELNKSHMGGFDNYGADDLYNMEDVWNDRGYEQKIPKKRSNGSIHDNSMSNLYDSWRSEWNGYYYNSYYGNQPGSSHGSTSAMPYSGRRRSDYDTNF